MKKHIIVDIIALAFIILFAYTAYDKLRYIEIFQSSLIQSPLIGKTFAGLVSYAIPIIEIGIVCLLFFRKRIGLFASLILMSLFTLYLGYILIFAPKLPCSCGGIIQAMTWQQHLAFNIFFTLLAAIALKLNRQKNNPVTYNIATA